MQYWFLSIASFLFPVCSVADMMASPASQPADRDAIRVDGQAAVRLVRTINVPESDAAQIRRILLLGSPLTECLTNLFYYSFAVSNKSDRTTLQVEIHRPFLPGLFATANFREGDDWSSSRLPPYPEYCDSLLDRCFIQPWLETEGDWWTDDPQIISPKLVDLLLEPDLDFQANFYETGWEWLCVPPLEERRFAILSVPAPWPGPVLFRFRCRRVDHVTEDEGIGLRPVPRMFLFSPLLDGRNELRHAMPEEQRDILMSSQDRTLWQVFQTHDWKVDFELLQRWVQESGKEFKRTDVLRGVDDGIRR